MLRVPDQPLNNNNEEKKLLKELNHTLVLKGKILVKWKKENTFGKQKLYNAKHKPKYINYNNVTRKNSSYLWFICFWQDCENN